MTMDADRARDNTPVPVEVELPSWLFRQAEQLGIDLSRRLTEAIKSHLGVD